MRPRGSEGKIALVRPGCCEFWLLKSLENVKRMRSIDVDKFSRQCHASRYHEFSVE